MLTLPAYIFVYIDPIATSVKIKKTNVWEKVCCLNAIVPGKITIEIMFVETLVIGNINQDLVMVSVFNVWTKYVLRYTVIAQILHASRLS